MDTKQLQKYVPYIKQALTIPTHQIAVKLGYSADYAAPMRPLAKLPKGYTAMAEYLSGDRYVIMQNGTEDSGDMAEAAHYNSTIDTLFLPRAAQYDSDTTAWHALFHEGAHLVHHHLTGALYTQPSITRRAYVEIIGDTAAWAAMESVGIHDSIDKTRSYVHGWSKAPGVSIASVPVDLTATIASHLATAYTQAVGA